jgi:hypothetical protein
VMLTIAFLFTPQYGLRAVIIAHVAGALMNVASAYWVSFGAIRSLRTP